MLDPSKRFVTTVLLLGIAVLVAAIALGERAGDRVMGQVTEKRLTSIAPITVTPAPKGTVVPYGPDWKRTDVMAAAPDPGFPDPRVPPEPPPTPTPEPRYTLSPMRNPNKIEATPNINVPIWRRYAPIPTATPLSSASPAGSPSASPSPTPSAQP